MAINASFVKKVSGKSVKTATSDYLTRNGTQNSPVGTFVKQVTGSSLTRAALARYGANKGTRNSPTASFIKQVSGTSLKSASLAYYRNKKGGYTLQPKRGRTSQKDPVAVALNRYAQKNVGASAVAYVYSSKSRVIRGTEHLLAVKLASGAKGWITSEGKFLSEEQLRNVLKSVDATSPASVMDVKLLDIYDSLTAQQKAEFAEKIRNFDWDKMFEEMYPKDGVAEADEQMDAYFELLETLGDIKGWGKVI